MTLDELLVEWSYRTKKGYPDLGNPSDILILKEILEKLELPIDSILDELENGNIEDKENDEKEKSSTKNTKDSFEKFDDEADKRNIDPCTATEKELINIFRDMVNSGDINPDDPKQLKSLLNRTCAFRLEPALKKHLVDKGFSSLILKDYARQIRDLTEKESTKDRKIFNDYLKDPSRQISLPPSTKGNLKAEMRKSGLPDNIITKLITHTAQDEGKKGVGMGELALAIVFKNITDSVGKGDLAIDGEYFEIKAQAATLGAKPEAFKASLDTVKKFEEFGIKREPVPNKSGKGSSIKLTFNGQAYRLSQLSEVISLAYQTTGNKDSLKNLVREMLLRDAQHSQEAVDFGMKDMDLTSSQSIQSSIAKIHFYNYIEKEGFTHFLAHDMGQKSKKGIKTIIGDGEYIYVNGTPGEMADKLIEAGATFEKVGFNNMRPRIGFGSTFTE